MNKLRRILIPAALCVLCVLPARADLAPPTVMEREPAIPLLAVTAAVIALALLARAIIRKRNKNNAEKKGEQSDENHEKTDG